MHWIRYVVLAAAVSAPQLCFAEVLDSFVGHFPFDKVNGRNVYQVRKVRQSMDKLLGKQRPKFSRALRDFGRGAEIEALEDPQLGRLIYVLQFMEHVAVNQAALFLQPDGEVVAACLSQIDKRGLARQRSGWGKAGRQQSKIATGVARGQVTRKPWRA